MDDEAISLIRRLADNLYAATLVGYPAPVIARVSARMRAPVAGDLVIERSTPCGTDDRDSVGRIVKTEQGPNQETIWVLRTLDGRVLRWANASFVAVPETGFDAWIREAG